jgi:dienelactone hydrolase
MRWRLGKVRRLLTAAVAAVALQGCTNRYDPTQPRVETGIPFADGLKLDLYRPVGDADLWPAVVLAHGGGFVSGRRQDMSAIAGAFARRGYLTVTIDYRLSKGGWFPATSLDQPGLAAAAALARDDMETAVAWLRANAEVQLVDPRRIAVAGYSAGGMTALAVAADPAADVLAAAAISAAAVDPGALESPHVPLLLLHGDLDDIVPANLADRTCAAALTGGPCRVVHYADVGHELPNSAHWPDVLDQMDGFLAAVKPR